MSTLSQSGGSGWCGAKGAGDPPRKGAAALAAKGAGALPRRQAARQRVAQTGAHQGGGEAAGLLRGQWAPALAAVQQALAGLVHLRRRGIEEWECLSMGGIHRRLPSSK